MLLTKELETSLSDKLYMKVLELNNTDNIILECEITEPQMKGILLSGDFSLIDGHIYYNNNIIKVRYDLMKLYGNCQNQEELYFNQYFNILNLKDGDLIKTNCPIDSAMSHRLTYVVINTDGGPKNLILVPYLHERRIHLLRQKPNTEYFYTSKQIKLDNDVVSYVFAFNLTEHKLYSYTDIGILIKRIDFSDIIKTHGEIICSSSNGLNFALFNRRIDTITLIRFSQKKVTLLKSINVEGSLIEYFSKSSDKSIKDKSIGHWILDKKRAQLHYDVKINDRGDLLIQINKKADLKVPVLGNEIETVYFYQANFKINKTLLEKADDDFMVECRQDLQNYVKDYSLEMSHGQNILFSPTMKKFEINRN